MTTDVRVVLSAQDVRRAITRIAHEIVERNHGTEDLALVGLQRGGVWMAHELAAVLTTIDPSHPVPVASFDVRFHRDDDGLRPIVPDTATALPVLLAGRRVALAPSPNSAPDSHGPRNANEANPTTPSATCSSTARRARSANCVRSSSTTQPCRALPRADVEY